MSRRAEAEALLRQIVREVAEGTCELVHKRIQAFDLDPDYVFNNREALADDMAAATEGSATPDSPYARLLAMVGDGELPPEAARLDPVAESHVVMGYECFREDGSSVLTYTPETGGPWKEVRPLYYGAPAPTQHVYDPDEPDVCARCGQDRVHCEPSEARTVRAPSTEPGERVLQGWALDNDMVDSGHFDFCQRNVDYPENWYRATLILHAPAQEESE